MKMQKRGHNSTVLEYRSQTKLMHIKYKRVVALGACSEAGEISWLHFDQLHHILNGDRCIKAKRVVQGPQNHPVATGTRDGCQTPDQGRGSGARVQGQWGCLRAMWQPWPE